MAKSKFVREGKESPVAWAPPVRHPREPLSKYLRRTHQFAHPDQVERLEKQLQRATRERRAYVIAEKQLYSSHYFDTALDLSFCVRDRNPSGRPGFYLIMAMGTEQSALAGFKGGVIRKVAVGRSVSNLQAALTNIRNTLEANPSP